MWTIKEGINQLAGERKDNDSDNDNVSVTGYSK